MINRILMCQPRYLRIVEEINAHMNRNRQPDIAQALKQHAQLVKTYIDLEVEVIMMDPHPDCPDMCFPANDAHLRGNKLVLSNFVGKATSMRQKEIPLYLEYFKKHADYFGYELLTTADQSVGFEGQSNLVSVGNDIILVGYGQGRNSYESAELIRQVHGLKDWQIKPIELTDPMFYDLDTACIFIPPDIFLYYPQAFNVYGRRIIDELPVRTIKVSSDDAERFVLNGVFIKRSQGTIFVTSVGVSQELKDFLQKNDIRVVEVDTSEFWKSGGSARCLSLFLPYERSS